jgi:hypothetical protein
MISAAEVKQTFFLASLRDPSLHRRPTIAIDVRALLQVLSPLAKFIIQDEDDDN